MLADWIHIDQMHADADVCPGSTYTGRRIYMQEGEARREQLLQMLRDSTAPISGSALARSLVVSRQVIVQDIALLRAVNKEFSPQRRDMFCTVSRRKPVTGFTVSTTAMMPLQIN